jgi:hypothetical protein
MDEAWIKHGNSISIVSFKHEEGINPAYQFLGID